MNLAEQFVTDLFVATIKYLRDGGAGFLAGVGKLGVGNLEVIHEKFQPRNDVHNDFNFKINSMQM